MLKKSNIFHLQIGPNFICRAFVFEVNPLRLKNESPSVPHHVMMSITCLAVHKILQPQVLDPWMKYKVDSVP